MIPSWYLVKVKIFGIKYIIKINLTDITQIHSKFIIYVLI